ncbi:MAG: type II secretion system F family protein [Planctomycetota bacterium]|nr:type II secretion system F family protein [Planctomycetota bacterium]MCZ6810763.1 type II secretion system F family protein [Planctomycetota bacterium]
MPSFGYHSLTVSGEPRQGVIVAADRPAAIRLLLDRGQTATSIESIGTAQRVSAGESSAIAVHATPGTQGVGAILRAAFSVPLRRRSARPVATRTEMANLMRELATALEAGLPIMQSLRTVRRQSTGRAMPVILDHLIERVEAGTPLHQAAREYGLPFDDLIVGMLRAADASGKVAEVLHQLADLLERSLELRREVLGATLYPMIVAAMVLISSILLVTVLVPRLIAPLAGEFTMPLPTRILIAVAAFLSGYWIHCLIGIALVWFGWRAWAGIAANRLRIDRLKLRAPLFGRLLRDVAVARFTRTLGTLVSAGIPILDALQITRDTLGNTALAQAIDDVQESVTSGKALAEPLEKSGRFPPLLVQVVNLGERSGRLESMLMHAAGAFDRQVNSSVKLFTRALPPVLIMIMATLAGFVLAAILLPLLELQSMVR